jgi:predicted N-acetyltransferase YhbS
MNVAVSDLREQRGFFDVVADRIWRAWWKPHGVPLTYIARRLRETLGSERLPCALVAHVGETFAGTASVITSDLDERPQYTPWVAAVWVEPEFRSHRLARKLVERAVETAFAAGYPRVYLTTRPERRSYYAGLGWQIVEEPVGPLRLTVFVREAPGHSSAVQ